MAPKVIVPDNRKSTSADRPAAEAEKRLAKKVGVPTGPVGKKPVAPPADDDDEEDDEELDLDTTMTTRMRTSSSLPPARPQARLATVYGFVRPLLANYKKILVFVGLGVLVETLFNVIMPLSLKFLIDDALGEEDFEALYRILGVLAAAGIFTSVVAIWYERWDARLAACVISDVRARLFAHVQELPAAYFQRTKRGEILSRFSVDLSAFEGAVKSFANSAALPFLELIAGIVLMLFLNWQLAVISLLVFPITLIGPRMLTPKAVQANYEQKLNEAALLGMVQENVAAQAVIKAFSLHRKVFGWFSIRNDQARDKIAPAMFLSTMVERTVTISVLLLHLVVLALGAYLATKGQITVGTFVTFESAFWEVSYNIAHVMHFIPVSISSAAAVRHMQELLDEPTRGADREGAPDLPRISHDITFEHVTFQYDGSETPVLDNLSLKLDVGKRIAIVGPSGSGKSTLLEPDPAPLRAGRGPHHHRRCRHPQGDQGFAAPEHGGGVPGEHAVQHVDPREHPARQGRCDRCGGRGGRPQGRDPSLHHEPAAEIRHLGRRTRRHPIGRPASAHRHRTRHHPQSFGAAAGRGDLGARPDHRGRDQPYAAQGRQGPHHDLVDPPADVGGRDGRDHRDRGRPGDRARHPCRAAGQKMASIASSGTTRATRRMRPIRSTTATTMMMTRMTTTREPDGGPRAAWRAGPPGLATAAAGFAAIEIFVSPRTAQPADGRIVHPATPRRR